MMSTKWVAISSRWVASAAVVVCLTTGTAQAASYTFDFTKSTQSWLETITFASVENSSFKLMTHAGTHNDRVAGNGIKELAIFALEKAIQATSVSFATDDSAVVPARYEYKKTPCWLSVNGDCKVWNYGYDLVAPSESIPDMFDLFLSDAYAPSETVGPAVAFANLPSVRSAAGGASGRQDAFRTAGLSAGQIPQTADAPGPVDGPAPVDVPTPVPLPAAGLLLLTAMGGIAALKRRRKAA